MNSDTVYKALAIMENKKFSLSAKTGTLLDQLVQNTIVLDPTLLTDSEVSNNHGDVVSAAVDKIVNQGLGVRDMHESLANDYAGPCADVICQQIKDFRDIAIPDARCLAESLDAIITDVQQKSPIQIHEVDKPYILSFPVFSSWLRDIDTSCYGQEMDASFVGQPGPYAEKLLGAGNDNVYILSTGWTELDNEVKTWVDELVKCGFDVNTRIAELWNEIFSAQTACDDNLVQSSKCMISCCLVLLMCEHIQNVIKDRTSFSRNKIVHFCGYVKQVMKIALMAHAETFDTCVDNNAPVIGFKRSDKNETFHVDIYVAKSIYETLKGAPRLPELLAGFSLSKRFDLEKVSYGDIKEKEGTYEAAWNNEFSSQKMALLSSYNNEFITRVKDSITQSFMRTSAVDKFREQGDSTTSDEEFDENRKDQLNELLSTVKRDSMTDTKFVSNVTTAYIVSKYKDMVEPAVIREVVAFCETADPDERRIRAYMAKNIVTNHILSMVELIN